MHACIMRVFLSLGERSHTGAARSLADWIGVGAAKPAMEQEVARLGKAGEGRLARVSELVLLRPCAYDWLFVVMGEAEDVTMPASA